MTSIQNVINENFLNRVVALQKGEKRQGAALSNALRGGNQEDTVITSIRAGAQMYSRVFTGLNFGISFLNFARADLEQVGALTDEMIKVVGEAASPKSSRDRRLEAQRILQDLGRDVKDILEGAKVGDREYLTGLGIEDTFVAIGLDPQDNADLREIFGKFSALDREENLIDPSIKGRNSAVPRELGRASPSQESQPLFDGSRAISKAADAYAILDDLKALKGQIDNNLLVVDELAGVLGENALLARTTALAFLDIQEQITSIPEATEVARDLQRLIIKDAKSALSQAENLEPLLVATLTYNDNGIVVEG